MMEIAKLKASGSEGEANKLLDELKRDHPRANDPITEDMIDLMVKHMSKAAK